MSKYLLKRIVYLVIVFFVVSLMMYAIYNLIPSDPAMIQMEPLRKTLKPDIWQQQYQEQSSQNRHREKPLLSPGSALPIPPHQPGNRLL